MCLILFSIAIRSERSAPSNSSTRVWCMRAPATGRKTSTWSASRWCSKTLDSTGRTSSRRSWNRWLSRDGRELCRPKFTIDRRPISLVSPSFWTTCDCWPSSTGGPCSTSFCCSVPMNISRRDWTRVSAVPGNYYFIYSISLISLLCLIHLC